MTSSWWHASRRCCCAPPLSPVLVLVFIWWRERGIGNKGSSWHGNTEQRRFKHTRCGHAYVVGICVLKSTQIMWIIEESWVIPILLFPQRMIKAQETSLPNFALTYDNLATTCTVKKLATNFNAREPTHKFLRQYCWTARYTLTEHPQHDSSADDETSEEMP